MPPIDPSAKGELHMVEAAGSGGGGVAAGPPWGGGPADDATMPLIDPSAKGKLHMVKAAVLAEIGKPLEIRDDIEVEAPHAGEVRIRFGASGVCHSDLSMQ